MNESKIGVRYAKAFFELAKEKKSLAEAKKDIELIQLLSTKVTDFKLLVESPVINAMKKTEIFRALFKGQISEFSQSFIDLIVANKREFYLNDITRNFLDMVRKDQGIKSAFFSTAITADPELIAQVQKITEKYFDTKVELTTTVNPELLGGYILRVEDRQVDASVSSKLNKIKSTLVSTDFEIKY